MAKYIFSKIILDSFMSYDHEEFDLTNEGIIYLKGVNNKDSKTESNGSGKSALVSDSIMWCLTGYTTRLTKDISNKNLDRGAYVSITLYKDNNKYIIERGLAKSLIGNTLRITKNDELIDTNKKDSQQVINSELNELSWNQLLSIVVLSQGLSGSLSSVKSSDRRKQLELLSGTDDQYNRIVSLIDNVNSTISKEVSDLNIKKSNIEGKINSYKSMLSNTESKLSQIRSQNESLKSDEYLSNISKLESRIKELDIIIDNSNSKLSDISVEKRKVTEESRSADSELRSLESEYYSVSSKLQDITSKINKSTSDNTRIKTEYQSAISAVCPKCGQGLSPERKNKMTSELESSLVTISSELMKLYNDQTELINTKNNLGDSKLEVSKKVSEKQKKLSEIDSEYYSLSSNINKLTTERNNCKLQLERLSSRVSVDESIFISQINEYKENIEISNKELKEVERELSYLDNDVTNISWLKRKSSKDLRSYLLQGVVSYINTRTTEYSKYLFDEDVVSIVINGASVDILLGDQKVESLSGGERRRVDIILQLSLRDLVLVDTGFSSNVLIVDEALDYLDTLGVSSVLDLMTSQKDAIDTLILITHKTDADVAYDKVWTVIKNESGITRLEV